MIRYTLIILYLFISILDSQDFNTYRKLIDEGKLEEVQESLPYLNSEYPGHPFISYLNASVISDGEQAYEQFKSIVNDHPDTHASELSIMKIGEYLYSQGLYTQASQQLKSIPMYYPASKDIERAVDLMKKSFLAIGEQDSVDYYIAIFSNKYPHLNFSNYDYLLSIILPDETPVIEKEISDSIVIVEPEIEQEFVIIGDKPWVVQVGAFSEKKNANILAGRLSSSGYTIEILENSGKRNLHLVQIVRFDTIEEAIIAGEDVNDKFGIEFRVMERN